MTPGDVVYLSGYGLPRISPLPSAAQVFVDPGPLVAQIPADLLDPVLARCDWLSCNQREAGLLTGSAEPSEAARLLLGRTDHASIIVRTGASGCVLAVRGEEMTRVPAPVVEAVDTTGAATPTPACSSPASPTGCLRRGPLPAPMPPRPSP